MQKIRVKIKAYDSKVIDAVVSQISSDVSKTGAKVIGPIPLPNKRSLFCVHRGPHIDAKSKEHFELIVHQRLIDIEDMNAKTIEALTRIQAPAGVNIEIKQLFENSK